MLRFHVLIEGESLVFSVQASRCDTVSDLKKVVHRDRVLNKVVRDPQKLVLSKVSIDYR